MIYHKILVAGTFDRFHLGHQYYLWQARALCEEMVVIVARDKTVERIKGRKAVQGEGERKGRLEAEFEVGSRQYAVGVRLGRADGDFYETIREEAPDAIFLGYDQRFDEEKAKEAFPEIRFLRCEAYHPEVWKSSKFKE